jgi:hypothetical protein
MKLLTVQMAKVIWLFDTQTINPRGLAMRDFFAAVKEKYGFVKAPLHEQDRTDGKSLDFNGGVFHPSGHPPVTISFNVFSDGIVAQTSSDTDHTAAFLEDLREFTLLSGFLIPNDSSIHKGYVSTLEVETKTSLLLLNPKLEAVIKFLETRFSSLDGNPRVFEFTRLGFFSEDVSKSFAPVPFLFERRIEHKFSENLYFAQAPLQTKDHIESLELLENILKS